MSRKRLFGAAGAAVAGMFYAMPAHAQWQITTYKQVPGTPFVTSMAIADQYFTGALPARFDASSTVDRVDLFENGGTGQFATNQRTFPGLDGLPGGTEGTDDYTARITGTLVITAPNAGLYDFWTDSDDGNRFRLDLNQNGTFEDATESIVPDGGLQGAGTPERSAPINLAAGSYNFEVSFFERGGGSSIEAGYRPKFGFSNDVQFVVGDGAGGITMPTAASVRNVGARANFGGGPLITNFAGADALRTGPNQAGFPVTEFRPVYNLTDSGGTGDFPGDTGVPGLGAPDANDDDDFIAVGRGILVVPAGGITNVIFRSNTDDGGRLLIDRNQDGDLDDAIDQIIVDDVLSGPHNMDSNNPGNPTAVPPIPPQPGQLVTLAEGRYLIEYSFFERGGGAEGEVSANTGPGSAFRLLGDTANGGLQIDAVPEPSALTLLALGGVALLRRQRR